MHKCVYTHHLRGGGGGCFHASGRWSSFRVRVRVSVSQDQGQGQGQFQCQDQGQGLTTKCAQAELQRRA